MERRSLADARLNVWSRLPTRAVAALCALALLTGAMVMPETVTGTELGDQISSSRRSQSYFESLMLGQDAVIAGILQQTRETSRALKEARRGITRSKRALRLASAGVLRRAAHLAELEARYAGSPPEGVPAGYADRVRTVRREVAQAQARRQNIGQQNRTWVRLRGARQDRLNVLRRQRRAAVARRESAEGGLGAYIVQLTRLAQERAEILSSVRLSAVGSAFSWPSIGRIAQNYGCTGFYLNPPRGSCRHFHDGLDIVAGYGSRVRTAADGVVAYAGWNPWDEGGRAWIMVVSHPDGYVTRYGHLLPGGLAHVGEFVLQGQAIGRMGNTGNSLGTHLHFELLSGGTAVSPWDYLPAGMVLEKAKDGKRSGKQADRSRHRKGKARGARDGSRGAERQAEGAGEKGAAVCEPGTALPLSSQLLSGPDDGDRASGAEDGAADGAADGFEIDSVACLDPGTAPPAGVAVEAAAGRQIPRAMMTAGGEDLGVPRPDRGTSPTPA